MTVFHPSADADFDRWLTTLLDDARGAPGYVSGSVSRQHDAGLDPGICVVFARDDQLHDWLDAPRRQQILRDGQARGYWQAVADIVTAEGLTPPAGVACFRHHVVDGRDDEFLNAQTRISAAVDHGFPGFLGTAVFPCADGGDWLSVLRFRTEPQLGDWLASDARKSALPQLRSSLTTDFAMVSQTTPFGTTVRADHGRIAMTPTWKTAMLVLMVLYPTVMLLSRFLGPALDAAGAQPWLAMWLSQVVSIVLMQWWLVPALSRPLARWLDPVDGAGRRVSAVGATAVVVVYVVTLTLFAVVQWLQYWDYRS